MTLAEGDICSALFAPVTPETREHLARSVAPIPETSAELRDWLRGLKEASGLSYAQIAREIGEEERNVKRWMTKDQAPVIPRGEVVLRLLSALGVRLSPQQPPTMVSARELVEGLRDFAETATSIGAAGMVEARLLALEATVVAQGEETTKALKALSAGIRKLARQLADADPPAKRRSAN